MPSVVTPLRCGYRPVMSDPRDGAHTGALAYQLVKRAPEAARASRWGDLKILRALVAEVGETVIVRKEDDEVGPAGGGGRDKRSGGAGQQIAAGHHAGIIARSLISHAQRGIPHCVFLVT